ncbi:hypothetical protein HQ587_05975 [bacterium]|nr:hypothetical protein [bacterium]
MMNPDRIEPGNGWSRWENHVLAELRRLSGSIVLSAEIKLIPVCYFR